MRLIGDQPLLLMLISDILNGSVISQVSDNQKEQD